MRDIVGKAIVVDLRILMESHKDAAGMRLECSLKARDAGEHIGYHRTILQCREGVLASGLGIDARQLGIADRQRTAILRSFILVELAARDRQVDMSGIDAAAPGSGAFPGYT